MPFFFGLAVFANAVLLFAIQPAVAKMVLPVLGGTPAVWNTCMVFFQTALLGGYAFAHAITVRMPLRWQTWLYPLIQLLVFLSLPIGLRESQVSAVPRDSSPIPWLLLTLLVTVGWPFFIVATTGTLLQRWFASTDHPAARDPYFLYAVSNCGSILALLGYPVLLEPWFTVTEQSRWWTIAYGCQVVLTMVCARLTRVRQAHLVDQPADDGPMEKAVDTRRRLHWVALAFVPSSLMLGVTTYLTNDIGSVPMLWVIPLSLYLFSFIMAFARRVLIPRWLLSKLVPPVVIGLTILLLSESMQPPVGIWIMLHLASFFVLALFCHGELAADRPSTSRLTEYYLWLAVGGMLGGIFNALIAPVLFTRVLEYPFAVVLACLLRQPARLNAGPSLQRVLDWVWPCALGILTALLIVMVRVIGPLQSQIRIALMTGIPALVCYSFVDHPRRFALGISTIFLVTLFADPDPRGVVLLTDRGFFGVMRVTEERDHQPPRFFQLVHGNTIHGRQHRASIGRPEPLSYYHRTGPIGEVFRKLNVRLGDANIGVIGLGVGAMAAYAEPGQSWTFYEIDPAVKQIAENTKYFRFLDTCQASSLTIVSGDARLRLREAPDQSYDLLVLDAFSSDSVPIHLLTREALQLYLAKLKPHGMLAIHISNRYLDLKPVLYALANDAGLMCRYCDDFNVLSDQEGKDPSQWVVMVRQFSDLGDLSRSIRWFDPKDVPSIPVWTDDFSNIFSIVRWRQTRED